MRKDGGGQIVITTSHDGYLKIANRDPNFDGLVGDVVYRGDNFRRVNGEIQHAYGNGHGDLKGVIGAYALVYKKNTRFPVYFYAPMSNYWKDTRTWKTYPHAMILKVAENMAIKRAFSLSGLVSIEELGEVDEPNRNAPGPWVINQDNQQVVDAKVVDAQQDNQAQVAFKKRKDEIYQMYLAKTGNNREAAKVAIFEVIGAKNYRDITPEDLDKLEMMPNFDSSPDIPTSMDVDFVPEDEMEG